MQNTDIYDFIIVGSGTCGATLARDLALGGRKVLVLECGQDVALKESLGSMAAISDQVKVGDKLMTMRALTAGGSSAMYFGVVNYPPLDVFAKLGIDLQPDLAQVKQELSFIAPLGDSLLSASALRLREAATALGHNWHKHDMLIDQGICAGTYQHAAYWRAKSWLQQAQQRGVSLLTGATVTSILIENGQATGVQYQLKKGWWNIQNKTAYGKKIILCAGELATPKLLRDAGITGVGSRGFFCNPGYALYGLVPGMQGHSSFVGSMGMELEDGIELGDANVSRFMHKLMMPSKFKFKHWLNYPQTIGIGVKVKDQFGGEFRPNGSFYKGFTGQDMARLQKGEREAIRILQKAGATNIFNFGISCAGRVGGFVAIGEQVDTNFETAIKNLHVCDGAVIPEQMRGTPTITLLCMAKYLARKLTTAP